MTTAVALGAYSNAVANFEAAAAAMLTALRDVQDKGKALPVPAHDPETMARITALAAAATLNLSSRYPALVVAVKGA